MSQRVQTLQSTAREIAAFVKEDKLWWLSPILFLLLFLGAFQVSVQQTPVRSLMFAMF